MAAVIETKKEIHFGGCPHDCPDTCAMLYEVEDGRLVGVKGNPDHPMTRGGLCVKLADFEKRHNAPDRLTHPLKRVGPKGSKQFEPISWDEALDTIETRWKAIIDEYGPEAILPYSYLGNQGLIQGLNGGDHFFNRLGATVCERTFCGEASCTAYLLTVGPTSGLDPESFVNSKYIILWACNSISTNLHHWHFVKEAQDNGAKVVVIDAYRSRTAQHADWHLMPKPGTDGALAMALIHTLIEEGLTDDDYIANYTEGFDQLAERAKDRTPEWAAGITGIPAEDIRRLAREYATTQPAAIRIGVALERHYGGGQTIRAVCCLPGLTGAWRHNGGGLLQMPVWEMPYRLDQISRPDLIPKGTRVVNALQLGRALNGEMPLDPPIMSMMCWNANPVTQAPESDKIVAGLEREDLFMVSAEHFLSDTASYADIVLPAAMAAEMEDIVLTWGHFYLTYNEKCIDPPGEAVPNSEIFRRLSKRFGFDDDPRFTKSDSELLEDFIDWDSPACDGIDLDYLKQNGFAHVTLGSVDERAPHAQGNFPTPSGKLEFYASGAANGNFVAPPFRQLYEDMQPGDPIDPLPDYVPPRESPASNPELAAKYPLNIISPKSHAFLNSCYANMEKQQRTQGDQFVLISAEDAAERGIGDGDPVRVFNDRGEFEGDARITDEVQPGVIVATLGYWRQLNRKGTVNIVSSAEFVNMGHAPTFSDNLVEVAPVAS